MIEMTRKLKVHFKKNSIDFTKLRYILVCSLLFKGISFFLDISLTQGSKYLSTKNVVPMFIMEPLMFPFLNILSSYISSRSGGEVTIILENEKLTDATFYRIIRGYDHRVLALNMEDNFVNNIKNLRPVPSYFSAVATSEAVEEILKMVNKLFVS